jgi:plasmid stabilization system protein ParE
MRQFGWYLLDKHPPDTAFRFLDAVEEPVRQLLRTPQIGTPKALLNPALADLRSWPVSRFDEMRLYYTLRGETVSAIRVLHGRRDVDRILKRE